MHHVKRKDVSLYRDIDSLNDDKTPAGKWEASGANIHEARLNDVRCNEL